MLSDNRAPGKAVAGRGVRSAAKWAHHTVLPFVENDEPDPLSRRLADQCDVLSAQCYVLCQVRTVIPFSSFGLGWCFEHSLRAECV